mmetsp:Transcript_15418/g.27325  ORF Transcript_15418/g.27325 Transcript_15418/m.27325 type:complete len:92 (+) Transcript_15418:1248-1523(+)
MAPVPTRPVRTVAAVVASRSSAHRQPVLTPALQSDASAATCSAPNGTADLSPPSTPTSVSTANPRLPKDRSPFRPAFVKGFYSVDVLCFKT